MPQTSRVRLVIAGFLTAISSWFTFAGCTAIAQRATAQPQPLSYVGEVSLGEPTVEGHRVTIPLSFSGGEWSHNSAIVPYRIRSNVSGREIDVTVTTAVVGDSAPPQQIALTGLLPGDYAVFYRDPDGARHRLGQILVP